MRNLLNVGCHRLVSSVWPNPALSAGGQRGLRQVLDLVTVEKSLPIRYPLKFHVSSKKFFSATSITLRSSKMSSGMRIISTSSSAAPRAPYSQAVAVNGFIYCSGQVPMTPTGELIVDDIQKAALQSLTNLKLVLEAAGSSIEKIFKVNVYLVDMADFAAVNEVYSEFFGSHRPARTCIAIKALPLGAHIEIECIALE
ncbi:Endoribonuclease L-PSP/chorismate mutase-like protein [Dipodascopsis uninucleata]